jgi:alkylated DNA repair protein (DNA oxidative demethylase)
MNLPNRIAIADGVTLWPQAFDATAQAALVADVFTRIEDAPFYKPRMPGSGKPFSVEETNFGSLGWLSDRNGYRYEATHPVTGRPWPAIPDVLLDLWHVATTQSAPPECCLVNLYRGPARMGLHQDKDEAATDVPVLSLSLGDTAQFRIGGTSRRAATRSLRLSSGDVLTFGGSARLAYHGVDRVLVGTSRLIPGGGRINLTLRRVTPIK